jgi:hypothetical protein
MQLPDLLAHGPAGGAAAADVRERMVVQEAAIASAVAHPHVVSVFSVGLRPCRPPRPAAAAAGGGWGSGEGCALTPDMLPRLMAEPVVPRSLERGGGADGVLWQLTSGSARLSPVRGEGGGCRAGWRARREAGGSGGPPACAEAI